MKKDIFWNSIGTAAWSFLSLFLLIVVTRINGIEESGLFSFAFAFALIMFMVACYGGRTYQVSDHGGSFSASSYISLRLLTSFIVIIITTLFILLNGYDWHKSALILLLVGHRIFDAVADVFYGILQKKHHLYISGRSLFFKSILSLIIFIAIDALTRDLLLAALSLPVISLLFVLFYDIPRSRKVEKFGIKFEPTKTKKILRSTFLSFSIAVMILVFANIARYFIDIYHPNLQGHFGIIIMPLSLIILLFSFILTPTVVHLSDKYNNLEFQHLRTIIRNIISAMIAATLLLSILIYFIGVPLLGLLFNVDFSAYIVDIVVIVLIGFMLSITSLFTNIAIIARKLRATSIIYLLSSTLLAALCILLVPSLEVRGAIIAYVIASAAQLIAMRTYYLYLTRDYSVSRKS